jgi:orotidine-5'-phosphate decarboxylase
MVPADSTTESEMSKNKIIVALDGMSRVEAFHLAKQLEGSPYFWGAKGNDLLDEGDVGDTIERFSAVGHFFADAKFHDIPKTVANRVKKIARHGASMITVHASGGVEMVRAAVETFEEHKRPNGIGILCVTVLTSLDKADCERSYRRPPLQQAAAMALIAKEAGAWGVVCSPDEVGGLSTHPEFKGLKFVTVGLRPTSTTPGDQKRFATPEIAFANGATLGVIGRPITEAPDPRAALNAIGESIFPIRNTRA